MPDLPGAVRPVAPDSGSGASDGSGDLPVKLAKLDATALHDDTPASPVPPPEACSHAVLACGPGLPEEHYVSEAVDDAPRCRGYRDACTITGTGASSCQAGREDWGEGYGHRSGAGARAWRSELWGRETGHPEPACPRRRRPLLEQ